MSELKMTQDAFQPRDYQKPVLDFEEILETLQTEIKIRVHKSVCTYDHVMPDGDEHYIVDFPFIDKEYYYDMLLSFGNKCECLEPIYVRTEMKRRIHEMAAIYGN